MVSRIYDGKNTLEIIQNVNIAEAIYWLYVAWKDVSTETIIHCFQKCGFKGRSESSIAEDNEMDEEFESLCTQLREDDEITPEVFFNFDHDLTTSAGQINTDLIDWRQQVREEAINEVLPNVSYDSQTRNEVGSDDDEEEEEKVPPQLTTSEALQHLDDLLHFSLNKNDEQLSQLISKAMEKVQNLKLYSMKQSTIKNYFSWK